MKSLASIFWISCMLSSSAEARARYVRRFTPSPSPSPSPTPTPTPGCFPSATSSSTLSASSACASGRQTFALQISDCKTTLNGEYLRAIVSYTDKFAGSSQPVPADRQHQATLYTSLQACSGNGINGKKKRGTPDGGVDCGGIVPADPTLFYLDDKKNLYVDPSSKLGVNGSWVLGKRLSYLPATEPTSGIIIMTPSEFYTPGAANETADHASGLECGIDASTKEFACGANGHQQLMGIRPQVGPLWANVMGRAVEFGQNIDWESDCLNLKVCGHWTIKAVPACT